MVKGQGHSIAKNEMILVILKMLISDHIFIQQSWWGGILDSPCPSVCLSVRPSVGDMVSGA